MSWSAQTRRKSRRQYATSARQRRGRPCLAMAMPPRRSWKRSRRAQPEVAARAARTIHKMKAGLDTLKVIPIAAPQIGEEERQAVLAVLDSGQLAQGPTVEAFEHEFAQWCGVPHAVALNSRCGALHLLVVAQCIK